MSPYKEQKSGYLPSRLLTAPAYLKVVSVIQTIWSKITGTKENNAHKSIVQHTITQPQASTKHDTVINLLNSGKNYDAAEMIADVSADWNLDLARLDASKIDVKGKSVWINLED